MRAALLAPLFIMFGCAWLQPNRPSSPADNQSPAPANYSPQPLYPPPALGYYPPQPSYPPPAAPPVSPPAYVNPAAASPPAANTPAAAAADPAEPPPQSAVLASPYAFDAPPPPPGPPGDYINNIYGSPAAPACGLGCMLMMGAGFYWQSGGGGANAAPTILRPTDPATRLESHEPIRFEDVKVPEGALPSIQKLFDHQAQQVQPGEKATPHLSALIGEGHLAPAHSSAEPASSSEPASKPR